MIPLKNITWGAWIWIAPRMISRTYTLTTIASSKVANTFVARFAGYARFATKIWLIPGSVRCETKTTILACESAYFSLSSTVFRRAIPEKRLLMRVPRLVSCRMAASILPQVWCYAQKGNAMKREPYLNGEETLAREENAEVEAFIKGVVSHLVVAVSVWEVTR